MRHAGKHYRTIWLKEDEPAVVCAIDQRLLPHSFVVAELRTVRDMYSAIKDMLVRGAPLIGAAAAYGMYLAAMALPERARGDSLLGALEEAAEYLRSSRPTAVNLAWALDEQARIIANAELEKNAITGALRSGAEQIALQEVSINAKIGEHGVELIRSISERKHGAPVNILTHCNAGWLCSVDIGTATAPIYRAFDNGIAVHVWIDETRPRNQGASLTAWELGSHGVPYTLIADNAGGHLMQRGEVDLVIVGTDRTTRGGDVANKIGTYLKALAASDNGVPFYVAAPSSSIDWDLEDGARIDIEERAGEEVTRISGLCEDGAVRTVRLAPEGARAANPAFDVTPRRLITGLITERGICAPSEQGLLSLFPEKAKSIV